MLFQATRTETSRTAAARDAANAERREATAVSRTGCEILREHCKPVAIDAAIAAAGANAGTWIVAVLEREDAAFAVASDALALLAGTALTPTSALLSQVLEGVISGKSAVREASLLALERLPALSDSSVDCPRDALLGRTLWIAKHDPDKDNATLADDIWKEYNHPLNLQEDVQAMLVLLAHRELDVRVMTARAIAECLLGEDRQTISVRASCIPQMFTIYLRNLPEFMGGLAPPNPEHQSHTRHGLGVASKGPSATKSHQIEHDDTDDNWHVRHGIGLALRDLAVCGALTLKDIPVLFAFLASRGLGDLRDEVRSQMSAAALAVVDLAGGHSPALLLPMIDKQLSAESPVLNTSSKAAISQADRTRENLVMCLGCVANHLPPDDPRKIKAAEQVVRAAVETPSEAVQNAAARCLAALASTSFNGGKEHEFHRMLSEKLWNPSATYGERRGAAYALAGIVRGMGLKCLKKLKIMEDYWSAAEDKSSPRRRQGAFLGMETMAIMFGRLYEPYVVRSLPIMLIAMGDSVMEVRDACWAAAEASMSEVSSLGVKMVLPSLLTGLKERQWRIKAGAAEALGAMAFCAPRQLSLCLPQVVPHLADALADAHPKVVGAAESAINRIAAVVRSPEVRDLSRFLLAALRDPATRTQGALDALLGTEFIHAIDPASLALLIPPLHRGLRDRSSEMKKRAAAIVGSMCNHVSNHEDVVPYLDLLLPDLRTALLDAIPDVRRTSALALGALALSLGERGLPGMVQWLIAALLSGNSSPFEASDNSGSLQSKIGTARDLTAHVGSVSVSSSAERSGVAMGLAEVCVALSDARIEDILRRVLAAGECSAQAREGGLMLLASLPRSLGDRFENRLPLALSSVLRGLSDDSDNVREAALDAGRKIVSAYAKTSLEILLPEIVSAMRDKLWRIRYAATQLLGDLLITIAGAASIENKLSAAADVPLVESDSDDGEQNLENSGSDDEDERTEEGQIDSPEMMAALMTLEAKMKAIEDVLGLERLHNILASLFIVRCDVSIRVRQMGMQVWKSVVANSPRTLREIMPNIVSQIVDGLSDEDDERRAAAGRALGDLSQKLGDRVIPEVLPALQEGIKNPASSSRARLGACEGLAELVSSCAKEQLVDHSEQLLGVICDSICDSSPPVRACAAEIFASLLKPLGSAAVHTVVPFLIHKIGGGIHESSENNLHDLSDAERALDGLRQVLQSSGSRLLSIVIPKLLEERPLSISACRALAAAAAVADSEIIPYIPNLVESMLEVVQRDTIGDDIIESRNFAALELMIAAIVGSGQDTAVVLLEKIYSYFNDVEPRRREAAGLLCRAFCRGSSLSIVESCASGFFEVLIRQLTDTDGGVVSASWHALDDLTTHVSCSVLSAHVAVIRQALRAAHSGAQVGDPTAFITGLSIPKGPAPFVPIFTESLLHGAAAMREQAALAIADLVEMTPKQVLSPYIIKVTGPLIRVISERFPWQVKAAILRAMLCLLEKYGPNLRTFAPQLQSTFTKCLMDPNRLVRVRGCSAIGALVPVQSRTEPLLNELLTIGQGNVLDASRAAAFDACRLVFDRANSLPTSAFTSLLEKLLDCLDDESVSVSDAISSAVGALACRSVGPDAYCGVLDKIACRLEGEDVDYLLKVRLLNAMRSVYVAGAKVTEMTWGRLQKSFMLSLLYCRSTILPVQCAAGSSIVDLYALLDSAQLRDVAGEKQEEIRFEIKLLLAPSASADARFAVLQALKRVIGGRPDLIRFLSSSLVTCAGESNSAVRIPAERVLRRAFLQADKESINSKAVEAAKSTVDDDDKDFIDRRVLQVLTMPESDDESESQE